ncbi:MAG: hypothetical protein ACREUW_11470 [Burkholderiales bacterium]
MRLRHLLPFLLFAPLHIQAAVNYKNSDFELKLGSDWTRTTLIGADHMYFESKQAQVSFKMEVWKKPIKRADLDKAASRLIDLGIKREQDDNRAGSVTITKQTLTPMKEGVRADYSGRDSTQRSFRFVGFVQENKVIYLYFETPTRHEDRLQSVVFEVLDGLKY